MGVRLKFFSVLKYGSNLKTKRIKKGQLNDNTT